MTPVLAISGYSGSGKTTLLEALLPRLRKMGLAVAVVKHDAHRLTLDHRGKDTDRFFSAGAAAVCGHDAGQVFVRTALEKPLQLAEAVGLLPPDLDLVLVEGHKRSPVDKLVLEHPDKSLDMDSLDRVVACLEMVSLEERVEQAERLILSWLKRQWLARPVVAAVFTGGQSRRMGRAKALLEREGSSVLEQLLQRLEGVADEIVLVGGGPLPEKMHQRFTVFPDAAQAQGPLAGLLTALRQYPHRGILTVACDMVDFAPEHARFLLQHRAPGRWVVAPQTQGAALPEPFGSIYEPMMLGPVEKAVRQKNWRLRSLLGSVSLSSPTVPAELEAGWRNINTPQQWQDYISLVE